MATEILLRHGARVPGTHELQIIRHEWFEKGWCDQRDLEAWAVMTWDATLYSQRKKL